jgi:uracil-DNA glycosylase
VKVPPSLRNIFKEIDREMGNVTISNLKDGSLVRWAEQGVLLLNTSLTVEDGAPASHAKLGWEGLTDALITRVAEQHKSVVFMLWGSHAQAKQALLQTPKSLANKHLVLCANHPSPLSAMRPPAPFLGCGHFGLANAFLAKHHAFTINW